MAKGQRIAELRNRKNESQSALAKAIHVSPSTIGMWETNQRAIKDDDLSKLADHFGVTTDYLLGRKINLSDVPVTAHSRNRLSLDDLPEERYNAVLDYIEYQRAVYKRKMKDKVKKGWALVGRLEELMSKYPNIKFQFNKLMPVNSGDLIVGNKVLINTDTSEEEQY